MAARQSSRRRRRSPEEAQAEIIEAAEALLRERPFRELTVDEVMRRTQLSRPSFYVYFPDRHQLVLRVVQHIEGELFSMSDRWYRGSGDGAELVREALEGVVAVFERHGPVLKALADAATDDPAVERVYGDLVRSFIDATAEHIVRQVQAGAMTGDVDPRQTATALILMNERYLSLTLGAHEPTTPPEVVIETLTGIWTRALYGRG